MPTATLTREGRDLAREADRVRGAVKALHRDELELDAGAAEGLRERPVPADGGEDLEAPPVHGAGQLQEAPLGSPQERRSIDEEDPAHDGRLVRCAGLTTSARRGRSPFRPPCRR